MTVHEEIVSQIKTMRKNLKELRKEKSWSFEELSKKSGINVEILKAIEVGKDFNIIHLFTLSKLYNLHIQELFSPIKK